MHDYTHGQIVKIWSRSASVSLGTDAVVHLGKIKLDRRDNTLEYKGKARLRPQCVDMLLYLWKKQGKSVPGHELRKEIKGKTEFRKIKSEVWTAIKQVKADKLIQISPSAKSGYILEYREEAKNLDPVNEAIDGSALQRQSPFNCGFILSLDSITFSLVSDLLFEDAVPSAILHLCRRSFQRSLEDFAFAVVYGTRVATGRKFRQSASDVHDRRLALIDQLGPIWMHHVPDESLKEGGSLRDARCQREIRRDLTLLDKSIQRREWPFKEILLYTAHRHLGNDESLLDGTLPATEYRFDVQTTDFYHDDFLERAIEPKVLEYLSRFARQGRLKNPERPSENAIQHFVKGLVLSLVAVMHEYRISCGELGIFRIPHVVRCVIQETADSYNETKHQQLLRSLLVQHVLATAFRDVHSIDKRSLVTVLLRLREERPFSTIRHILEDASLVLAHPDKASEKSAERLYRAIKSAASPPDFLSDRFGILGQAVVRDVRAQEKAAALKELGRVGAVQYESQLYRLFPELSPMYPLQPMNRR